MSLVVDATGNALTYNEYGRRDRPQTADRRRQKWTVDSGMDGGR